MEKMNIEKCNGCITHFGKLKRKHSFSGDNVKISLLLKYLLTVLFGLNSDQYNKSSKAWKLIFPYANLTWTSKIENCISLHWILKWPPDECVFPRDPLVGQEFQHASAWIQFLCYLDTLSLLVLCLFENPFTRISLLSSSNTVRQGFP